MHLKAAREFGNILVVTVTPDQFVTKGPGRPVFNQNLRLEIIAALEYVDYVTLNKWPTAVETIHSLKPHVYAKGQEYADYKSDVTGKIVDEAKAVQNVGGEIRFTEGQVFSSSTLINKYFKIYPPETEAYLEQFRKKHTADEVVGVLQNLADVRVLLIGEAILDQYCYCIPLAKSPRESIVSTKFSGEENFAGGSLAIANHLAGFCKQVTLITTLGQEQSHSEFINSKMRPNVKMFTVETPDRPTIVKRRYLEPSFLTKMFEIQYLDDTPLPLSIEEKLYSLLEDQLPKHDIVLVSDFGHGLMTERLRKFVCSSKIFMAVNTQSNSANLGFNAITRYSRADYVCIHEFELRIASRVKYGDTLPIVTQLLKDMKSRHCMVTRGLHGTVLYSADGVVSKTPALNIRALDRVGAGDSVLSVTSPCVYKNCPPDVLGFIANCVGALAIEIVCNREPIDPITLQKFITHLLK